MQMIMAKLQLIVLFLLIALAVSAQTVTEKLRTALLHSLPQEKIYLHLDKPSYWVGDTIWFKVYALDAYTHRSDTISSTLFVDIIRTDSSQIIEHQLLKNSNEPIHSSFILSETFRVGVYEIRAYTNWMRNFPEELFFRKEIKILKGNQGRAALDGSARDEIADLQFFPEGGNLVYGLPCRVAFKAINRFGKGVNFKANVISNQNELVADIQSEHLGMGSFSFTPMSGQRYFVKAGKEQKIFYLPEPDPKGYSFFIDNLSDEEFIHVKANCGQCQDKPILFCQQRGTLICSLQSEKEGDSFSWDIKRSEITNEGIVQLTLFNGSGLPQCERLIYSPAQNQLRVFMMPEKKLYGQREKVNLFVRVEDHDGHPVQGNFSLSVTDGSQVTPEEYGMNISNYLHLTSDIFSLTQSELKGTIEQPGYYFDRANKDAAAQLDILLMTQGWRRFIWSDVLSSPQRGAIYPIEKGISISGTALPSNGKAFAKPINISLLSYNAQGMPNYFTTKTGGEGKFQFTGIDATSESRFFLQGPKNNGGKDVKFILDPPDLPAIRRNAISIFYDQASTLQPDTTVSIKNTRFLKEVIVKDSKIKNEPKKDPRRVMYEGLNTYVYKVDQKSCNYYSSVLSMLKGRVPSISIGTKANTKDITSYSSENYTVTLREQRSFNGTLTKVIYLVDGAMVTQGSLDAVRPCDIESVEIITGAVSMLNAHAVISVLSKTGGGTAKDEEGNSYENGVYIKGYHVTREFYSPKYMVTDNMSSQKQDSRSTLYWNPKIKTDDFGRAKVVFWNSDQKTKVNVRLEGISNQGQPVFATTFYSVE
jgi:hypothetical protein